MSPRYTHIFIAVSNTPKTIFTTQFSLMHDDYLGFRCSHKILLDKPAYCILLLVAFHSTNLFHLMHMKHPKERGRSISCSRIYVFLLALFYLVAAASAGTTSTLEEITCTKGEGGLLECEGVSYKVWNYCSPFMRCYA